MSWINDFRNFVLFGLFDVNDLDKIRNLVIKILFSSDEKKKSLIVMTTNEAYVDNTSQNGNV